MKRNFWSESENAVALPEYSILISVIAVVVAAIMSLIGTTVVELLQALVDVF
jgi:Flp pilus assembly pilin Flp